MLRSGLPLIFALSFALLAAGCDDDEIIDPGDDEPVAFTVTVENVGMAFPVLKSGAVASPGGPDDGPAIFPGETATFSFTAPANTLPGSGMRLNLATMFVQSNDLFYAFRPEGLALYDEDGNAVTGDVTEQIFLYDAGTEVNEEPGVGPNQKPRQSGPDTGPDENGTIAFIPDDGTDAEGFSYPAKEEVIEVTIEHDGETEFTVSVTNVSDENTLETSEGSVAVPLSPFAWAVHTGGYAMYEVDAEASRGIEWIAEDGFPADMLGDTDLPPDADSPGLLDELMPITGVTVPLSPGGYAVHSDAFQLFAVGGTASEAIEAIAEDGNAMSFGANIPGEEGVASAGVFNTPEGADGPGPIGPGGSYAFDIEAEPGQRLSLATMYVQSNDIYYAFAPEGLALFDDDGNPVSGDVTSEVVLYDAGTEVDEEPGVGPTQVIRQGDPDTGEDENGTVVRIGDGGENDSYTYPPNAQVIRVTIAPQ